MMNALKLLLVALPLLCLVLNGFAQTPTFLTDHSTTQDHYRPLDGIVRRTTLTEKRILPYAPVREADVLWEKKIWRIIDIREKMNLPFAYPVRPFFTILKEAAANNEITVYSVEDDQFTTPLTEEEIKAMGATVDTVPIFDPDSYDESWKVIVNEMAPEDVKRFRIKEIWYFDESTSTLKVRILGIAPLVEERDENGNFRFERPMFWVYYPDAREVLAREAVFNMYQNDAAPMTWEDLFEMRFFSSYITKESNVFDRRLEHYLAGTDLLMESEKIKQQIFNFEHDLWSY